MNITENIQRIQQAKIDIRNAIIQKGVSVSDTLTIDNFADKILQIEGGGGGEDNLDKLFKNTLTSYTVPNGVTSIKPYAFYSASTLASVTIPYGVAIIGNGSFQYCSGLTSIGEVGSGASVEIPNSVSFIGQYAFGFCRSLTSVTIPNSVTTISSQAFYYCTSLTSVTWYSTQQYIPNATFQNCSKLKVLDLSGGATQVFRFYGSTSTTVGTTSYIATNELQYIVIPDSLYDEWYASSYWANFTNYLIKKSDYDAL